MFNLCSYVAAYAWKKFFFLNVIIKNESLNVKI